MLAYLKVQDFLSTQRMKSGCVSKSCYKSIRDQVIYFPQAQLFFLLFIERRNSLRSKYMILKMTAKVAIWNVIELFLSIKRGFVLRKYSVYFSSI